MKNSEIVTKYLNINSNEYINFLDKYGLISDERGEIYGYLPNINIDMIPSVIAATNLYKDDYNLKDTEIVIGFDDYKNMPIILSNNRVYLKDLEGNEYDIENTFNNYLKKFLI